MQQMLKAVKTREAWHKMRVIIDFAAFYELLFFKYLDNQADWSFIFISSGLAIN